MKCCSLLGYLFLLQVFASFSAGDLPAENLEYTLYLINIGTSLWITMDSFGCIAAYLHVLDLISLSRTSKEHSSLVFEVISRVLTNHQVNNLITESYRVREALSNSLVGIEDFGDPDIQEIRRSLGHLKYFQRACFKRFQTGEIEDWHVAKMKYIKYGDYWPQYESEFQLEIMFAVLQGINSSSADWLNLNYLPLTSLKFYKQEDSSLKRLINLLIRRNNSTDLKRFGELAKIVLEKDKKLSDSEQRLLEKPDLKKEDHKFGLDEQVSFACAYSAAVYLSNDENWETAWEYCQRCSRETSILYSLIGLSWAPKNLLKRLASEVKFPMRLKNQVFGRYLQGSLDEEVYLALLQGFNGEKSIEDRENFVGLSTSNPAGALLEKMVFTGEKDENKLREIIKRVDFKPDLCLAIACAVKGLSPNFLREMLEGKDLVLSSFQFFDRISSGLPLDHINIDSLKVLLEAVMAKTAKYDIYFLSTDYFMKDEVLLELAKHAFTKTKGTLQINGFWVWHHPRTAHFLWKEYEQKRKLASIIEEYPLDMKFRKWIASWERARQKKVKYFLAKIEKQSSKIQFSQDINLWHKVFQDCFLSKIEESNNMIEMFKENDKWANVLTTQSGKPNLEEQRNPRKMNRFRPKMPKFMDPENE